MGLELKVTRTTSSTVPRNSNRGMPQVLFSRQLARIRFVDRIAAAILLSIAVTGVAWAQQSAGHPKERDTKKHRLRRAPAGSGPRLVALLRMFLPLGVESDTYWLVIRSDYTQSGPPTELQFMVGSPEPQRAIFTERTTDYFLYAMLPQGDVSPLVATVWETGDRQLMRIFIVTQEQGEPRVQGRIKRVSADRMGRGRHPCRSGLPNGREWHLVN